MLPAALPFFWSGATAPGLLISGRGVLLGFSMAETANAAAVWSIFDGSTGGNKLFRVNLMIGESTREWLGPMGIAFEQGLFVSRTSGTIDGCVFVVLEERGAEGLYITTEDTG